ncbi:MAG: DUF1343 domain-containing protein, partial [Proteobacteria bacterium]|nr:DUF1343 domain-containing protein [Pseudomonadota bacterium]
EGWTRGMLWPATGRAWVPTSPNITTFETALAYPGTGLFEATTASEGRGTAKPFLLIGHPAVPSELILDELSNARLPGVRFAAEPITPHAIPHVATSPRFDGHTFDAISLAIDDWTRYRPVETGLHLLAAFATSLHGRHAGPLITDHKAFDRLAGTDRLAAMLRHGTPAAEIISASEAGIERFCERRTQYLLYR